MRRIGVGFIWRFYHFACIAPVPWLMVWLPWLCPWPWMVLVRALDRSVKVEEAIGKTDWLLLQLCQAIPCIQTTLDRLNRSPIPLEPPFTRAWTRWDRHVISACWSTVIAWWALLFLAHLQGIYWSTWAEARIGQAGAILVSGNPDEGWLVSLL